MSAKQIRLISFYPIIVRVEVYPIQRSNRRLSPFYPNFYSNFRINFLHRGLKHECYVKPIQYVIFKKSLAHSNSVFACQPHLQHLVFTISSFVDFIVDMRCSCKWRCCCCLTCRMNDLIIRKDIVLCGRILNNF